MSKESTVRRMAIRSVWAVARRCGLAGKAGTVLEMKCRMSTDDVMLRAMVRCFEAGYRARMREEKTT